MDSVCILACSLPSLDRTYNSGAREHLTGLYSMPVTMGTGFEDGLIRRQTWLAEI